MTHHSLLGFTFCHFCPLPFTLLCFPPFEHHCLENQVVISFLFQSSYVIQKTHDVKDVLLQFLPSPLFFRSFFCLKNLMLPFSFCLKNSLQPFLTSGCASDNPFSFYLSEKVFTAHLFLKDHLLNIEFMVYNAFLSAFEKFYPTSFCTLISNEKSAAIEMDDRLWAVHPFSGCLQRKKCGSDNTFNFVFSCQNFIYDVSWCQFILDFPIWNSLSFSNLWIYVFCQIQDVFSKFFFKCSFSLTLFSASATPVA